MKNRKTAYNSTCPKVAVQCFNKTLCPSMADSALADPESFRDALKPARTQSLKPLSIINSFLHLINYLIKDCTGTHNINILQQTATFRPKGLLGRLYWYSVLPLHFFVFNGMAENIVRYKS